MNTPKLPPLPEASNDNRKYGRAGFHASNGPVYTAEQIQAYALAAIEAQGVPDIDALTDAIAEGLKGTYHCTRVWEAWSVGTMGQDDFEPVDESDTPREIAETVIAMLASAPPAQQSSEAQGVPDGYDALWNALQRIDNAACSLPWFKVAHEGGIDAVVQNIIDAMLASAPPAPQASEVQQEPVAWKHDCAALLTNDVELWIDACPHCGKPRTNPTQQAKPQPLLSSEIWNNDAIMEVNADAQLPYELIERFVRAVEAVHNIGDKK